MVKTVLALLTVHHHGKLQPPHGQDKEISLNFLTHLEEILEEVSVKIIIICT